MTKSPKILFRDSGLLHHFLGIRDRSTLDVHPMRGHSWENFVVEGLIARFTREIPGCRYGFWRTLAGGEVDLILDTGKRLVPIEVKLHTSPVASDVRGLSQCVIDLGCERGLVLHGGAATYSIGKNLLAIPAPEMLLGRVGLEP